MTAPILLPAERIEDIADLYSSEQGRAAGHVRELLGHIAALAATPPPPAVPDPITFAALVIAVCDENGWGIYDTAHGAAWVDRRRFSDALLARLRAALAAAPAKAEGHGDWCVQDAEFTEHGPRCKDGRERYIEDATPAKAEGLDRLDRAIEKAFRWKDAGFYSAGEWPAVAATLFIHDAQSLTPDEKARAIAIGQRVADRLAAGEPK